MFSDEWPTLETVRLYLAVSTPTFLYLHLNTAYAAHLRLFRFERAYCNVYLVGV